MKEIELLKQITGAGRCDCHFTGCEHDRARDAIAVIQNKINKLTEQRDLARQVKLTQYHVVPFEDSEECQTHPWHSPRCYEQTRAAIDADACTCGLTKLQKSLCDCGRIKPAICDLCR